MKKNEPENLLCILCILVYTVYTMSASGLSDQFIAGMNAYGYTLDEIKTEWMYCGGEFVEHRGYFYSFFPKKRCLFDRHTNCVCGEPAQQNYYITNKKTALIIGKCCLKYFYEKRRIIIPKCTDCGAKHTNKIVNRCRDCRVEKCDVCGTKCENGERLCWNCYLADCRRIQHFDFEA